MSTHLHRILFGALVALTPLVCSAQRHLDSKFAPNLTLLTGPGLLSPPGQRTLTESGWSFRSVSDAEAAAAVDVKDAQERLEAAKAKLEKLQAEKRAMESKRGGPGVLRLSPEPSGPRFKGDVFRFDATVPSTPTDLRAKPAQGSLNFRPNWN
jgi:hypothetical protein